jgi:hypothetical protein
LEAKFEIIEDEFDLTSKILKNYSDIALAVRNSKNAALKLGGSISDINLNVERMVKKKFDVAGMFSGFGPSLELADALLEKVNSDINSLVQNASGNIIDIPLNFSPLSGKIDEELAKIMKGVREEKSARLDSLDDFFQKNKKLQKQLSNQMAASKMGGSVKVDIDTGTISTAAGQIAAGTKEYAKIIDMLEQTIVSSDIGEQVQAHFREIVDLMGQGLSKTDEQELRLKSLIKPLDIASKLMLEEFDAQQKVVGAVEAQILRQRDAYTLLNGYLDRLRGAEKAVLKIGQGFDYISGILPDGAADFLGLSKVSETLLTAHRKGVEQFSASILEGSGNAAAMSKYFAEFGPAIVSALNPMTLLVASALLLGKFLESVVQKYKDLASEMKVSLFQAKTLHGVQLDIMTSQKNQFATMEDIQAIQTEMIGSRGKLINLTTKEVKELTIGLAETGKVFGYGAEEAAKLHKNFKNLGADDALAAARKSFLLAGCNRSVASIAVPPCEIGAAR